VGEAPSQVGHSDEAVTISASVTSTMPTSTVVMASSLSPRSSECSVAAADAGRQKPEVRFAEEQVA
jgi:hypothetical protein